MIEWIDSFTNKFVDSLKNIERSKEMEQYLGVDKKLNDQVTQLENKYLDIMKIFSAISQSPAEKKIETIQNVRAQMNAIEYEMKQIDSAFNLLFK